jgi:alcohol dehydrogenase
MAAMIWASKSLTINAFHLMANRTGVKGWYTGTSADSEDALQFSALNAVGCMNEIFPLEVAARPSTRTSQQRRRDRRTSSLEGGGCGEAGRGAWSIRCR